MCCQAFWKDLRQQQARAVPSFLVSPGLCVLLHLGEDRDQGGDVADFVEESRFLISFQRFCLPTSSKIVVNVMLINS